LTKHPALAEPPSLLKRARGQIAVNERKGVAEHE